MSVELFSRISGPMAAVLAVWVLVRCARSLFAGKNEPEVWAYLELPDGKNCPVYHWECTIGSSNACDVVLPDPSVAKSHAALKRNESGEWEVYEMRRSGGVWVGRSRVVGHAPVKNGNTIRLGDARIRFIELSETQRTSLERKRQEPGSRISPVVTLLLLMLFELAVLLQHCLRAETACVPDICLAYGMLISLEWVAYFGMRAMGSLGFEPEILAFFLTAVGFSVCATAVPQAMAKECLLIIVALCLFLFLGWWLRSLRRVVKLRWPMAAAALALLAVNLVIGEEIFGAKNWLEVFGVSFQPSEFVKLAYVYAGAATLDRLFRRRNIFLFCVFSAACVGALALMGDFGTALVFFICFLLISYMRSGSIATVVLAVSAAVVACMLVITVRPHIAQRFAAFGHVWDDPYNAGYQQTRAMSAAASGGLFGRGASAGWLKDIVAADTDLVFEVVCEELGLVTACCCVLAVVLLVFFSVRSSAAARSSWYVIASCAASVIFLTQTALNVFGSLDMLPFTGVTFPFVSRGGSSLISCWGMLAYIKAADTRRNASFALSRPEKPAGKGGAKK